MPPVATAEEWRTKRLELLAREKAHTKEYDSINAQRRRMPMVPVDKEYTFTGEEGAISLDELFKGRRQLIVYHFMFGPDDEKGCPGCTSFINALGDLSELEENDTHMVIVSRAPLQKLLKYRAEHGWELPWYSSGDGDFNYDFHVTADADRAPIEYNYKSLEEFGKTAEEFKGDYPGLSVFFKDDEGKIYHTYSVYARGAESLTDSYRLLDLTPYGRQQDFEDSPAGWPQHPTYG
jgi:predicted dithiol-disulfide oxidoreductase (DUF899 family)